MTYVDLTGSRRPGPVSADDRFVGGWRSDLENRAALLARGLPYYAEWRQKVWAYPHPRPDELDARPWYDVHNQGNIGSCQGNALADAVEYAYQLQYGPEIQLSRFFAYRESQIQDGINGDQGSTLEGGGRAVRSVGICLESSFPYPSGYSAGLAYYNANREKLRAEAADYKLEGEIPLGTWDDVVDFLATRSGVVQIGIMWGSSMDAGWEIKTYAPGGGGHSVVLSGYLQVAGWPDGIGILLKNSWGTGWGREGWGLVHKNAVDAMLRSSWNVFVGRSRAVSPTPAVDPDL